MPITFYTTNSLPSPPARAVEIVIKILKLDVEKRVINLLAKEHLEPWYVKLSPTHQVPLIDDNGYVLSESHAIIVYLLTTYAPKDILEQYYPTDPKARGIIHSRWQFESDTLFAKGKIALFPLWVLGDTNAPLQYTRWIVDGIAILDKFLEGNEWLAAGRLTVADISTITIVDLIALVIPLRHYKNVSAWAERTRKAVPFYNEVGIEKLNEFTDYFKNKLSYDAEDRWNQVQSAMKK